MERIGRTKNLFHSRRFSLPPEGKGPETIIESRKEGTWNHNENCTIYMMTPLIPPFSFFFFFFPFRYWQL